MRLCIFDKLCVLFFPMFSTKSSCFDPTPQNKVMNSDGPVNIDETFDKCQNYVQTKCEGSNISYNTTVEHEGNPRFYHQESMRSSASGLDVVFL